MRIHLIKEKTIRNYIFFNSASKIPFDKWLIKIKKASWLIPIDIKNTFKSADFLGNGTSRVIFNIGGNNYRMICKYAFGETEIHLFVCWIGTHAEYNELCKTGEQFSIILY